MKYKQKLLFISNSSPNRINHILDAFKNRDDLIVEELHQYKNNIKRTFFTKVFDKLKLPLDIDNLNQRLLNKIDEFKPDIIFIVKGNVIYPWSLKKIKNKYPNIKLISFSNDNMSLWNNKSLYYHYSINYYDLVISIRIEAYKKIEKFCKTNVIYIDKSYSKKYHTFNYYDDKYKKYDVVFVGSYEKERFETMKYLANKGIKIDIFGAMWNKVKNKQISSNLNIHFKEVVGDKYSETLRSAKIVLGFLRQKNLDTQTSRTFEIPATGAFVIMQWTSNQDRLFKSNQEMVYFKDKEDLFKKIQYYLNNEEERKKIIDNAKLRMEKCGYSYDSRVDYILKKIRRLDNV